MILIHLVVHLFVSGDEEEWDFTVVELDMLLVEVGCELVRLRAVSAATPF